MKNGLKSHGLLTIGDKRAILAKNWSAFGVPLSVPGNEVDCGEVAKLPIP